MEGTAFNVAVAELAGHVPMYGKDLLGFCYVQNVAGNFVSVGLKGFPSFSLVCIPARSHWCYGLALSGLCHRTPLNHTICLLKWSNYKTSSIPHGSGKWLWNLPIPWLQTLSIAELMSLNMVGKGRVNSLVPIEECVIVADVVCWTSNWNVLCWADGFLAWRFKPEAFTFSQRLSLPFLQE